MTYPMLELAQISRAEGISLGNYGNQVDTGAEPLHNLDVKRLQGVTGWSNEVEASVHAKIDLLRATRLLLLQHVGLMLVIKELDNRLPRVTVVDIVTEARGIDNSEADYTASTRCF